MALPPDPKIAKFEITLGPVLVWISLALSVIGFVSPLAYEVMVLERISGVFLTVGFLIWAVREWRRFRRFSIAGLFLFLFWAFVLGVATPVMMSSKVARAKYEHNL